MEEVKYIPGDLVIYKQQICKVKGSVLHFTKMLYNVKGNMVDANSLDGLALTPAILEANGWKKNEYGVYYKNFNPHKAICLSKEDGSNWEVSTGGVTLIHCKFVHDLQHLLFGLGLNSELNV